MKFRIAPLLFVLIILISGCVGQGQEAEKSVSQFVGGEQGLKIDFAQLPSKVLQGDPFDINVKIENRGETDVPANAVQLQLSNSQAFGLADKSIKTNKEPLQKVSEAGGFGGQTFVTYEGAKYVGGVLSEESPIPITVEACYPYSTTAAFDLCVARNEFNDVCSTQEAKQVFNSGSPIHVTEVEQLFSLLTADTIRTGVRIKVKKLGEPTDRIYSKKIAAGGGTTCGEKSALSENEVVIEEIRIGNRIFTNEEDGEGLLSERIDEACGGSNFIGLDENGEGSIQCNFAAVTGYTSARGDYIERMSIKLGYLHSTVANTNIQVIPVGVG